MPSIKDKKKQKEKTSQALIQAALELCAEEGYASLSLRSVARKAGIAPTSFYRHFREIDEMGVEMVVQAKEVLTDCLTAARKKMTFPGIRKNDSPAQWLKSIEGLTRPFAETFINFMEKHIQLLHLFFQERTGSSEAMRQAISEAFDHLTELLVVDLQDLTGTSSIQPGDLRLTAETLLTIASSSGMELLTDPQTKTKDIASRVILKLNLLLLGALAMEQSREQTEKGDGHE